MNRLLVILHLQQQQNGQSFGTYIPLHIHVLMLQARYEPTFYNPASIQFSSVQSLERMDGWGDIRDYPLSSWFVLCVGGGGIASSSGMGRDE